MVQDRWVEGWSAALRMFQGLLSIPWAKGLSARLRCSLLLLLAWGLPTFAAVTITISPTTATVARGGTTTFTPTVSGTQIKAVTWSIVEAGGGTIAPIGRSNAVLYTAPMTGGTYHVKVTSNADPTKSATATVTVPSLVVTVSPVTVTLPANGTQQFSATVTGDANTSVTWSVVEANGGTASNGGNTGGLPGLYAAPTLPGTFHVKATSNADPSKSATATVTVTPVVTIAVSPTSATVALGGTRSFTATVGGTANTAVNWSATGGTLSTSTGATVTWTAPPQSGGYSITATSQEDPAKSATSVVNVPSTVAISVSPTSAAVPLEGSQILTATVTGTSNLGVSWGTTAGTLSANTGSSVTWTPPNAATTATVIAISQADGAKQATAALTVKSSVAVAVAPATVGVQVNSSQAFTATVSGAANQAVDWYASAGTVTGSGATPTWTAPATAGTYTLTATSRADTTKVATATISVTTAPPINITLTPAVAYLAAGASVNVTAAVTGSSNTTVNWSTLAGTLSQITATSVTWTAPQVVGTYTVTATSGADSSRRATFTVRVTPSTCP